MEERLFVVAAASQHAQPGRRRKPKLHPTAAMRLAANRAKHNDELSRERTRNERHHGLGCCVP